MQELAYYVGRQRPELKDRGDKNSHRTVSFGERGFDRIVSIAFCIPPVIPANSNVIQTSSLRFSSWIISLYPSIFSLLQFSPPICFQMTVKLAFQTKPSLWLTSMRIRLVRFNINFTELIRNKIWFGSVFN